MSEYFRVLERIRRDHDPAPDLVAAPAVPSVPPRSGRPAAVHIGVAVPRPAAARLSRDRAALFTPLLERLRTAAHDHPSRAVVLAGPIAGGVEGAVAGGLASLGDHLGLTVVALSLTVNRGRAEVRRCAADFAPRADGGDPLPLDLYNGRWQPAFAEWLRGGAADPDLVLIEGPPLVDSADSAWLACACSGLVIVAKGEVTPRRALRVAAEQARMSGCHALGVVMYGAKDRLPRWLRSILGDDTRPAAPGAD